MKLSIHLALAVSCALVVLAVQCSSPAKEPAESAGPRAAKSKSAEAWSTIYQVLQHPRCSNCHPTNNIPLQGDDPKPHMQSVQGGPDGKGVFAMQCATCHQTSNLDGAHLPPGAPNWHLPHPDMPLVFVGKSEGDLCRQMRDPAHNGKKTPEELFHHMAEDKLVLWGWNPGVGRTPVPIPHAELVQAVRTWVDGGCDCPK